MSRRSTFRRPFKKEYEITPNYRPKGKTTQVQEAESQKEIRHSIVQTIKKVVNNNKSIFASPEKKDFGQVSKYKQFLFTIIVCCTNYRHFYDRSLLLKVDYNIRYRFIFQNRSIDCQKKKKYYISESSRVYKFLKSNLFSLYSVDKNSKPHFGRNSII